MVAPSEGIIVQRDPSPKHIHRRICGEYACHSPRPLRRSGFTRAALATAFVARSVPNEANRGRRRPTSPPRSARRKRRHQAARNHSAADHRAAGNHMQTRTEWTFRSNRAGRQTNAGRRDLDMWQPTVDAGHLRAVRDLDRAARPADGGSVVDCTQNDSPGAVLNRHRSRVDHVDAVDDYRAEATGGAQPVDLPPSIWNVSLAGRALSVRPIAQSDPPPTTAPGRRDTQHVNLYLFTCGLTTK
jgi:hypothetical protein